MPAAAQLWTSIDAGEILPLVRAALRADPVMNTVYSSVAAWLDRPGGDGWCAHPFGRADVLAARSRPDTPLALTPGWTEVQALADAVPPLSGIGGPVDTVTALAAALAERGVAERSRMQERLFRLAELDEPDGVPGSARLAGAADLELLGQWYTAFSLEAFGTLRADFDGLDLIRTSLARGSRPWLWLDAAGVPVSLAVRHRIETGVSRIGPVYTVPAARGRGYGSGATAAATRDILAAGAIPVLYTDQANPTSNHIYQQLGYRAVCDRLSISYR